MPYWSCKDKGHVFKTLLIHERGYKSRGWECPMCCICGCRDCVRIDMDMFLRLSGRAQRKRKTVVKTLRNTFSCSVKPEMVDMEEKQ